MDDKNIFIIYMICIVTGLLVITFVAYFLSKPFLYIGTIAYAVTLIIMYSYYKKHF